MYYCAYRYVLFSDIFTDPKFLKTTCNTLYIKLQDGLCFLEYGQILARVKCTCVNFTVCFKEILYEDNTILFWISKLCLRVPVGRCFIELDVLAVKMASVADTALNHHSLTHSLTLYDD